MAQLFQGHRKGCQDSEIEVSDHFVEVNKIAGTAPEDLPTPDKSIKQLEKEHKKLPKSNT